MINFDLNSVTVNQNELQRRLGGNIDEKALQLSLEIEKSIKSQAECCFKLKETSVNITENVVNFGFHKVASQNLAVNLKKCNSAYIVAVTLGHKCDLILRQSAVKSPFLQFVTDAVASALIEAVCDRIQADLPPTFARFSAGYGDLPIEFQKPLLEFLETENITLTESFLMIPSKSVTFIAGRK